MKIFFDSSALVKRYIQESGTAKVNDLFVQTDQVFVSIIALPEVISALTRKRIEKKLSQAEVAKRAKMHQSAIARFETGSESPTCETASRILAAVGAKIKIS